MCGPRPCALGKNFETYIDDLDVRPSLVFDCFIMFFVITDTKIIIFDGFVRVPAFILKSTFYVNVIKTKVWTYIGRGDLDASDISFDDLLVITERFLDRIRQKSLDSWRATYQA